MTSASTKKTGVSFELYHKKNIFNLIDFKDIAISFVLTLIFLAAIVIILFADGFDPNKIITAFLNPDNQTLSDVFGNAFGGMMVGVMALLITVVAFVVQMAANRYTTKIVDLFISNKINLVFMTLTAVATVDVIMLLYLGDATKTMPRIGLFISFLLVVLLLISIFPYFVFIFRFIKPSNIIYNIEKETFINIIKSYYLKKNAVKNKNTVMKLHKNLLGGINQLTDITLNCIQNKDQILAIECIRSLRYLMLNYLRIKFNKPLSELWLTPSVPVTMDVSFITLAEESLDKVERSRFWVEDKILKQLEMIFRLSINQDRTICNYIANSLFIIGCLALKLKNYDIMKKMIMYFNTFLRATINGEDLRTCFNTLNQYRKLAEKFVETQEDGITVETVKHFKYYGLLAKEMKGMDFILETVAHDLCDINKKAYTSALRKREEILDIFLTVDMPIEGAKEISLRGIRMAQIRLAVYYLNQTSSYAVRLARKIYTDMLDELHRPDGYARIFNMIKELKYSRKDFWEINDREYNFNFIPSDEKKLLQEFFDWFTARLIILYAVEYTFNHNPAKAMEYLNDIKAVQKSLPEEALVEELEFAAVFGEENLDNKTNYSNQVLKLESFLSADDNLIKEISAQNDLEHSKLIENLPTIKKGIASFFNAFRAL